MNLTYYKPWSNSALNKLTTFKGKAIVNTSVNLLKVSSEMCVILSL